MLFRVDFKSGHAVHLQLIAQVKDALASGALRPGEALPSAGEVARELRINRNHISRAYEELESLSIIERAPGKGYCIKEQHRPMRKSIVREQSEPSDAKDHPRKFEFDRSDLIALAISLVLIAAPVALLIWSGVLERASSTLLATLFFSAVALFLQADVRRRLGGSYSSLPPGQSLLDSPDLNTLFDNVLGSAQSVNAEASLVRDHSEILALVNRFPALQRSSALVPYGNDLYLPLVSNDELLAVLRISPRDGRQLQSSEGASLAALAEDFARTATRLRARSEKAESEYALDIQRGLLPQAIPQVPGFTIAGAWQPAKDVGGDYYDVFRLNQDQVALVVADVSGKGAPAALLMSNVQATTKAYATVTSSPRELCRKVNAAICASITAGRFITFFFAVLDTRTRLLTYCNAGHNPPLIVSNEGDCRKLDLGGTVLGLFAEAEYQQAEIQLRSGDRLVMFTDGVIEAADSHEREFGDDRLFTALTANANASAADLRDSIMQAVTRFCNGDFSDDATLLIVVADAAESVRTAVAK